jgi:hypothetical protein
VAGIRKSIPRRGGVDVRDQRQTSGLPAVQAQQDGAAGAAYTHAQLLRFDNRFRARLLRAFKRGKERRKAAANRIAVPLW